MPFVHSERVRFGDLDAMKHLNNVVFLRYFETALRPVSPPVLASSDRTATLHRSTRSPAHFDEAVAIRVRVPLPDALKDRLR